MFIILVIAAAFELSGCSAPLIPLTPDPATLQSNSRQTPSLAHNQRVLCRTNSPLYPCIITSPKTPLTTASRVPIAPSRGTSIPPLMPHHDPLETEAHLADHENIASQLQEITSTLGPLLANLAGPESRHLPPDHPQPAAGKSSKKKATADDRDRAAVNSQDAPNDSYQAEPSVPNQTEAPSDLTHKNIFHQRSQGRDIQDLPSQNSAQNLDRSVPKRKRKVKFLASVYFSSNSTKLLPSEKIVLIDLLPLVHDKQLLFVGYSDRAGDDNANARLSYKRARAVKAFFAQTGHDPGKLFAGGRGACCDKTEGNTPTGQQQNRRVEIYHALERLRLQSPSLIKE